MYLMYNQRKGFLEGDINVDTRQVIFTNSDDVKIITKKKPSYGIDEDVDRYLFRVGCDG